MSEVLAGRTVTRMRVKDFTYYPLLSDNQCAFRMLISKAKQTYRQCPNYPRVGIEGYRFCAKHAEQIRKAVGNEDAE